MTSEEFADKMLELILTFKRELKIDSKRRIIFVDFQKKALYCLQYVTKRKTNWVLSITREPAHPRILELTDGGKAS